MNRTASVVNDLVRERCRQKDTYGEAQHLEDGTGERAFWLYPVSGLPADTIEAYLRDDYEHRNEISWMHLVREEVAEAFKESDPVRLQEELLQVAALCVSWVEDIRSRNE